MISLRLVLSGSRHLRRPEAVLHAVTYSRRDCLTAVWSTQAWGCGMCTHCEGGWDGRERRGALQRLCTYHCCLCVCGEQWGSITLVQFTCTKLDSTLCLSSVVALIQSTALIRGGRSQSKTGLGVYSAVNHVAFSKICLCLLVRHPRKLKSIAWQERIHSLCCLTFTSA